MSDSTVQLSRVATGIDKVATWFGRQERWVLLLGCASQVLVLAAMTVMRIVPLVTGDTILLRVVPVDPRDMFRGDYVILSYEFSRPAAGFYGTDSAPQTVYVQLEPEADGRHWRMAGVSAQRPAQGKFLRGKVTGWNRVEFGIESYYVQEGQGRQYEQAIRNRRLSAEVSVTGDGQAVLKGLHIE
jgi:uncharacterized membrane-anchored protein